MKYFVIQADLEAVDDDDEDSVVTDAIESFAGPFNNVPAAKRHIREDIRNTCKPEDITEFDVDDDEYCAQYHILKLEESISPVISYKLKIKLDAKKRKKSSVDSFISKKA